MSLPTDRIRNKATLLHDAAQAVGEGEPLPFDQAADVCVLQIDGGDAFADQTLTLTGNAANNETFTIGLQTYTWKDALSSPAVPNEVLVDADADASIDNAVAAIMATPSLEGTSFSTGTKENINVTAVNGAGDTMDVTARIRGTVMNTLDTTETMGSASWGAATLTGGTDFVGTVGFLATLDDRHFGSIAAVPLEGGAAVLSASAVGRWRIDMAGVALFKAPIVAYTSGVINVRILHRRKSQG